MFTAQCIVNHINRGIAEVLMLIPTTGKLEFRHIICKNNPKIGDITTVYAKIDGTIVYAYV